VPILFWTGVSLLNLIIANVLSGSQKPSRKELVFVACASLLSAIAFFFFKRAIDNTSLQFFFTTFGLILLALLYLYQIKGKSLKLAFVLTVISIMLFTLIDALALSTWTHLLGFNAFRPERILFDSATYLALLYAFLVCLILILRKVLRHFSLDAALSGKMQTAFVLGGTLVLLCSLFIVGFQLNADSNSFTTLFSWASGFAALYALSTTAFFVLYVRSKRAQQEVLEKEREHEAIIRYIRESKTHQDACRKIEHDFQNILASMELFIKEKDLDGLTTYYNTKIKPTSSIITQNHFTLAGLDKIEPREIRGLLTAKLALAQSLELDVTFECPDVITSIAIDPITLVRMLGILLDNAIEALTERDGGKLMVGCLKVEHSVSFIVQNTCPPDMPSIRKLSQAGFSSKGEGRGMGLHILEELADALPNVTLSTRIQDGDFVQILVIGGMA